ncbi:MAG: PAS domain-containing sensor histidine kinase [Burkholderiales bacterium]|nr:PAS domain-containing sensor histidine kinase [Burkholderiales bacterium]
MIASPFPGLDLITTAILLLDRRLFIRYANPAAESLFALNGNSLPQLPIDQILSGNDLFDSTLLSALESEASYNEHELTLMGPGQMQLQVSCTITPVEFHGAALLLEFRQLDQQLRIVREERVREQQEFNRELIRNLAHEIRNPLGGIRGAAQLLERELNRADLREYTGVIVKEAGRLQALMDRLLTPHRLPQYTALNIHEVLERVRSLILAETQGGLIIRRDYDTSLPLLTGDKEQLIQAALNIVRNASQASQGKGEITLRTRITRQVTLAKKRYRHALQVDIVDNGPGIPETLRDKVFYPLISGREGGSGLGLSLAQHYVHQHHGTIEFVSQPGKTCFTLTLPVT